MEKGKEIWRELEEVFIPAPSLCGRKVLESFNCELRLQAADSR